MCLKYLLNYAFILEVVLRVINWNKSMDQSVGAPSLCWYGYTEPLWMVISVRDGWWKIILPSTFLKGKFRKWILLFSSNSIVNFIFGWVLFMNFSNVFNYLLFNLIQTIMPSTYLTIVKNTDKWIIETCLSKALYVPICFKFTFHAIQVSRYKCHALRFQKVK